MLGDRRKENYKSHQQEGFWVAEDIYNVAFIVFTVAILQMNPNWNLPFTSVQIFAWWQCYRWHRSIPARQRPWWVPSWRPTPRSWPAACWGWRSRTRWPHSSWEAPASAPMASTMAMLTTAEKTSMFDWLVSDAKDFCRTFFTTLAKLQLYKNKQYWK